MSRAQRERQAKLIKYYRGLGVIPAKAAIVARCVIEKRATFGLFRSCGVPVKGKRPEAAGKIRSIRRPVPAATGGVGE